MVRTGSWVQSPPQAQGLISMPEIIKDSLPIIDVKYHKFTPTDEVVKLVSDDEIRLRRVWLQNGNKDQIQELYFWLANNFAGRPFVFVLAPGFTVPPRFNGKSEVELYHGRMLPFLIRRLEELEIANRSIIISKVNPGHGGSVFRLIKTGDVNLDQGSIENLAVAQATLLLKIRQEMNPQAIVMVANSAGAAAALIGLANYGDHPKVDLSIAYSPVFEDTVNQKNRLKIIPARILHTVERTHPGAAKLRPHIHNSISLGIRAYRQLYPFNDSFGADGFSRTSPDTIMAGLRSMAFNGRLNLEKVLSRLTVPDKEKLILLVGKDDQISDPRKVQRISARHGIDTVIIPARHDAMREDPNLVLIPIVDSLTKILNN